MLDIGIDFDRIIKHRVNRNYVIDIFTNKQNKKKYSPLRTALHNKTIENIHNIYDSNLDHFRHSNNPLEYYEIKNYKDNKYYECDSHCDTYCQLESRYNDKSTETLCFICDT